jgi:hypothetical protein
VADDETARALTHSFARLQSRSLHGQVGLVVEPCAKQAKQSRLKLRFGSWRTGPAWSTAKVPVVIWGLRHQPSQYTTHLAELAIRYSDNVATSRLRAMLGSQPQASSRLDSILSQYDSSSPATNSNLNGFGLMNWSLANQADFMAGLSQTSNPASLTTLKLMKQITSTQRWGLGQIKQRGLTVRFKGGWAEHGDSGWKTGQAGGLARQMGIITNQAGQCWAVALASESSSSLAQAQADLSKMAHWLENVLTKLPSGKLPAKSKLR